jgi:asparagine synthase (glutamine-hydrolysing)
MPIEHLPLDEYKLFERYDQDEVRKPEPYHWPLEAMTLDLYRHIAKSHRVVLTGDGGDPLSYFGSILNTPRFHKLVPDAVSYLFSRRRIPAIGLRTKLKFLTGKISLKPPYPAWLDQTFAKRLDLPARFDELCTEQEGIHPTHAIAYKILSRPYWQSTFERYDPGTTLLPLEFRHPLFDIRLIDFVLAIPLIPWCVDKELLRSVGRGIQPDEVRLRRKSPLGGDPMLAHLQNGRTTLLDHFVPAKGLANYVNKDALPDTVMVSDSEQLWVDLRPLSFNHWLHQAQPDKYKSGER